LEEVHSRYLMASNWVWLVVVLALTGVVVWGWAFDFTGA
jgi:hypothetical protein